MATINIASQDTLEAVASNVGATGDTGGSSTAGTLFGKLNKIISDIASFVGNWTATRAGYIDNIRSYTVTNNTASKTGVLSAKLAYIINLLENTTYGLSAIKNSGGGGLKTVVKTIPAGTNLYKKEYCFGALSNAQVAGLYCVHVVGAKAIHSTYSTNYFNISGGFFYINTQGNEKYTMQDSAMKFQTTMWGGSSGSPGTYYISPSTGHLYVTSNSTTANYAATTDITLTFYYFS